MASENAEKSKIVEHFQGHFRLSENGRQLIDPFCGTEVIEKSIAKLEEHVQSDHHKKALFSFQSKMVQLKDKTKKASAAIEKLAVEKKENASQPKNDKIKTVQTALNGNMFSSADEEKVKCNLCDSLISDSISVMANHALGHQEGQLAQINSKISVSPSLVALVDKQEHLKLVGNKVKCSVCHHFLLSDKKFNIERHLNAVAHNSQLVAHGKRTAVDEQISSDQFNQWLALSLSSSDIPFHKIAGLTDFLRTFTARHIPSKQTLARQLISSYEMVKTEVVKCLQNKSLWMSIDAATNSLQNYKFVSVIIGTLVPDDSSSQQVFVWCYNKVIGSFDTTAVVDLFTKTLFELFGENYYHLANQHLKLFVSDGASEMVAAAKVMKQMIPNLLTFTCVCHALHNLSISILKCYPKAVAFVSALNNALFSSPPKIVMLRGMPGFEKLPPKIIPSRWGTGLRALKYWHINIKMAIDFLSKFERNESEYIAHAKDQLNDVMIAELEAVATRYAFIPDVINKLETRNLPMRTSIELIENVVTELNRYESDIIGSKMISRMAGILKRNKNFLDLKQLLEEESFQFLKYAPAGSFDTERSIKHFKKVLSSDRSRLNHETVSQISFIKHNSIVLKLRASPVTNQAEKEKHKHFSIQPSFCSLFGLQQEHLFSVGEEIEIKSIEGYDDQVIEDEDEDDFEEVPLSVDDIDE